MTDDDHGGTDSLRDWIDRLEAFASSLGDIEGESATDFADNTLEALQNLALPHAIGVNLSALVIFEGLNALANRSTDVIMDWADTPDVRDRYTRDSAQRLMEGALHDVLLKCRRWLAGSLPSPDQIQQRLAVVAADPRRCRLAKAGSPVMITRDPTMACAASMLPQQRAHRPTMSTCP